VGVVLEVLLMLLLLRLPLLEDDLMRGVQLVQLGMRETGQMVWLVGRRLVGGLRVERLMRVVGVMLILLLLLLLLLLLVLPLLDRLRLRLRLLLLLLLRLRLAGKSKRGEQRRGARGHADARHWRARHEAKRHARRRCRLGGLQGIVVGHDLAVVVVVAVVAALRALDRVDRLDGLTAILRASRMLDDVFLLPLLLLLLLCGSYSGTKDVLLRETGRRVPPHCGRPNRYSKRVGRPRIEGGWGRGRMEQGPGAV
jgi:hypothetical protein